VRQNAKEIRNAIANNWNEYLSKYAHLFSSDSISGSSPPSVFVGSYGYPKVSVGPMVPPMHGDTSILDIPEKWMGKQLEEIVNFRLNLIRGIRKTSIEDTKNRFIENLQELSMSRKPIDSDIEFKTKTSPITSLDGDSPPFGPLGEIKNIKFSGFSTEKSIERVFYDTDLKAEDAVLNLYNKGIEISRIQKCFSIGMLGKRRKIVPTKWSVTATDDIISKFLVSQILQFDIIDSCQIFSFSHLGNEFSVIIFPHRWMFEMIEAWHTNDAIGFGNDSEGAKGIDHEPEIAGAYFAGRLAVAEYLVKNQIQASVLILREIKPEYAIPVGVWQVREGIRMAMNQKPIVAQTFDEGVSIACKNMSISKTEWLMKCKMLTMLRQKSISEFL